MRQSFQGLFAVWIFRRATLYIVCRTMKMKVILLKIQSKGNYEGPEMDPWGTPQDRWSREEGFPRKCRMEQNNLRNTWRRQTRREDKRTIGEQSQWEKERTPTFPVLLDRSGPKKPGGHFTSDGYICNLWAVPPELQVTNTNSHTRTVHQSSIYHLCETYHSSSYITARFTVGYQPLLQYCTEPHSRPASYHNLFFNQISR